MTVYKFVRRTLRLNTFASAIIRGCYERRYILGHTSRARTPSFAFRTKQAAKAHETPLRQTYGPLTLVRCTAERTERIHEALDPSDLWKAVGHRKNVGYAQEPLTLEEWWRLDAPERIRRSATYRVPEDTVACWGLTPLAIVPRKSCEITLERRMA